MTAIVRPIRAGHWADQKTAQQREDEDNRPTASTGALAFVVVACPFVLLGLVWLGIQLLKH